MSHFQMSNEQVRTFNDDGFVIVRGLFKPETMDLLIKIAKADKAMDSARGKKDASGKVSRLSLRSTLSDDIYSAFVRARSIADPMDTLLEGEVYHLHHKMMLKEPKVGGAWEWHQDYGYWYDQQYLLYPNTGSCLIAVDRATKENGCIQMLAGSHKCGRLDHGLKGDQSGIDQERVDQLMKRHELVYCECEPGDAVFFHGNTLHRSDANTSDNPRWSLICCYSTKFNEPYRPDLATNPTYSPLDRIENEEIVEIGRRQLDEMMALA